MKLRPQFPVDLLMRTPEKVQQRIEMGDGFMREIVEEGKVLYEADNRGVGRCQIFLMLHANHWASRHTLVKVKLNGALRTVLTFRDLIVALRLKYPPFPPVFIVLVPNLLYNPVL